MAERQKGKMAEWKDDRMAEWQKLQKHSSNIKYTLQSCIRSHTHRDWNVIRLIEFMRLESTFVGSVEPILLLASMHWFKTRCHDNCPFPFAPPLN